MQPLAMSDCNLSEKVNEIFTAVLTLLLRITRLQSNTDSAATSLISSTSP